MAKSNDVPLDSTGVSADISSANVLSVPLFEEVPVPSPAVVLDVPPGPVAGQDPFPSPAPAPVLPPGSVGGQSALVLTPDFLPMDPLLALPIVVAGLSYGVSKEVPSMVPLWGATVPSLVSIVTTSSLASGVSGSGCDGSNLHWQKATSLVEDGWTTVKGRKVRSSTPSFDMALRSHKKGSKGKV